MKPCRAFMAGLLVFLVFIFPVSFGWGLDGHFTICKIAQSRLSRAAADAVQRLLPEYANGELANVCIWADRIKFRYRWSSALHYPLHVGFAEDKGGNTIEVHWYTRKQNLHHIWDSNIIETAEEKFYDSSLDGLIDAIQTNITKEWTDEVEEWEKCNSKKIACTDIYASESIRAACDWAYKGVTEGATLAAQYFSTRVPVVYLRLAQGGVRLAAVLNSIFG
ncbi:Endonuclease 2, partial [Cucurbita argyrosperma subsp. argyrosperma]